ncbi:DUF6884 domain-containing protein [Ferrovibrio sp.]|uniref:DUF6884 domain-containing protein n=1 Tax=Ferrovibrio sp. TaxID=1917215 RepID=UPI0035B453BC
MPLFVIGCGCSKQNKPAAAKKLYISDRFRSSLNVAHKLDAPYVVLSGKHGVVSGEATLEPYDLSLLKLPPAEKSRWAAEALNALRVQAKGRSITILAAPEYSRPLTELNDTASSSHLDIIAPWEALEKPDILAWLIEAQRMSTRIHDLRLFYSWIQDQRSKGSVFQFRNLATQLTPKRGVYVFLDPREPNFLATGPRIVRIGTHAVSLGSKATLRGRLRNHFGTANGSGNHRGSIFRLHVGRAMLEATGDRPNLLSWGEGQQASADIQALEKNHELAVSSYLQDLEALLINVDDEPHKDSLRARVEAQLIALCSESMQPIDCPTDSWLGLKSPAEAIRRSGLWNIRGVGGQYVPGGLGSVEAIIRGQENGRS